MADFLVTYDITRTTPSPYAAVVNQAEALGWFRYALVIDGNAFKLPNTTLIGNFATLAAAKRSFEAVIASARAQIGGQVNVEKYILSEMGVAWVQTDDWFTPEA